EHHGARRNEEHEVFTVLSKAVLSTTVPAWPCFILSLVAKVQKRGEIWVYLENDIAAATAIATIGPAIRHVLFSAEGRDAIAAIARVRFDFNLVDKHL